ncbi:hypothetical protein AN280_17550 [Pseudomonas aeruginosa]|nr:hypothetical protein U769_09145 [Pseudomonas aeruginosa MTB-1]AOT39836.1 hypothetical protein BHE76_22315 [Pseudomonas aeruginosa]OFO84501.1 hypothetical protein HMPREF3014_25485 [Pseudomonas sp. HMSC065H01]OFR05968.1 hypothetical protein HMPREF2906_27695 [Pseudomonas sp. HMSC065H02]OHP37728.1 hypothetical protein HMPREF2535_00670 [Pseudomonas sp. HMSC060F12]WPB09205.1 hypothetical protein [Cloning vector pMA11O1]
MIQYWIYSRSQGVRYKFIVTSQQHHNTSTRPLIGKIEGIVLTFFFILIALEKIIFIPQLLHQLPRPIRRKIINTDDLNRKLFTLLRNTLESLFKMQNFIIDRHQN